MQKLWRRINSSTVIVICNSDFSGMFEIIVEDHPDPASAFVINRRWGHIDGYDLLRGNIEPIPQFLKAEELAVAVAIAVRAHTIWKIRDALENL